ncbi:MAG: hypothetical protein ACUVTL_00285 [Thermoproteota archaeon]
MSEEKKLKARLEIEDQSIEFEGTPDEVVSAALKYLAQAYPAISIVKKIVFSPDFSELVEKLSSVLLITDAGTLMVKKDVATEDGVLLVTAGADVTTKLGKRSDPSVSIEEIVLTLKVAEKTVRNVCSLLVKQGYIIRNGKGKYQISQTGVFHLMSRLGVGEKIE